MDKFKLEFSNTREKDLHHTYESLLQQAVQREDALAAEILRLKKDVKRLQTKNRQMRQIEQENINRIEHEVALSLNKVMNSQAASKSAITGSQKRIQSPF
jgi:hypothetical protein